MYKTSEMKIELTHSADKQTFDVFGVLIQFLATPGQLSDQISVMRGAIPPGVMIPLHSHADPEIFYVLEGSLEVFRSDGSSAEWLTAKADDVVSIPGNVKHALRNTSSAPMISVTITKVELFEFFRELAKPFDPNQRPGPPTPEEMRNLFALAVKYGYWMATPEENAAIGISL